MANAGGVGTGRLAIENAAVIQSSPSSVRSRTTDRAACQSLGGVRFGLLDPDLELIQADADDLAMSFVNHFQEMRRVAVAQFLKVDPGLVQLPQWRPDAGYAGPAQNASLSAYCGIGHKS
jgi:hypothetical protein